MANHAQAGLVFAILALALKVRLGRVLDDQVMLACFHLPLTIGIDGVLNSLAGHPLIVHQAIETPLLSLILT